MNQPRNLSEAERRGARYEREALLVWLRKVADTAFAANTPAGNATVDAIRLTMQAIEAGDHRLDVPDGDTGI